MRVYIIINDEGIRGVYATREKAEETLWSWGRLTSITDARIEEYSVQDYQCK